MPVHIIDSEIYGAAWGSQAMRNIFDEQAQLKGWLHIITTLAEAQADVGIIPAGVIPEIKRVCDLELLSMDQLRKGYEETGHSMLGLIRELKQLCQGDAGEWIYYGATVQDITDCWLAQALLDAWQIVFDSLQQIESDLLDLAVRHRETPMPGRTHGQPGLPITFGFKTAVWVQEIRRHLERLLEARNRLGVGQLAGGVGSLSAFGAQGLAVQACFLDRLGLRVPEIGWINSRDTPYEFVHLLSMIGATFDKIGHEIYTLQRPEIGEVREGFVAGTVGSITMPHKRNPEIAEHLGTLARLIRHNVAALGESLVHDHERDARSWKVEWGAIAPICTMAGALLRLSQTMCANLAVDSDGMLANLVASRGFVLSEGVMLRLAERVGKQTAHELVYSTAMVAFEQGMDLETAVSQNPAIQAHLSTDEISQLFDYKQQLGLCPQFVDQVAAYIKNNPLHQPS